MSSINYSLVDSKVKQTTTIPQVQTETELGTKTEVLADLTTEKNKYQTIIDTYTTKISEVQNKINAITAL